jgi:hypothetical protein
MATTINSGYANSPKLTANIADHADVYGGRALVFDGVTDYLDISNSSGLVNYDVLEPDGISFSAWVNTSVTSSSTFAIVGQGNSTGNGSFLNGGLYINNNKLEMVLYKNSSYNTLTGSINISADTWHHVCGVYSGENSDDKLRIYVDGFLDNTSSALGGNGLAGTATSAFAFIGRNINDTNRQYFNGRICDVKIFNSALTEAQVQELYLKPEQSAPSAVQDNLIAWYPMIEGNPESPQSIVYDHSKKKLGSELNPNPTFSNFTGDIPDGWTVVGDDDAGNNISQGSAGGLRIQSDGTAIYAQLADVTTSGKIYKYSITLANLTDDDFNFNNGGTTFFTANGKSEGTYTGHFEAVDTYIRIIRLADCDGEITAFSLKEVQMGNHATTNFFGDDQVTNGTFDTDANWSKGTEWSIGSGVASCDGTQTANTALTQQDGILGASLDFVVGKTYKLTFDLTVTAGLITYVEVGGGYDNNDISTTQNVTKYIVASSTNDRLAIAGNQDFVGTVDNVVVKEVGVSSSGFETSVNEPVVPQVPLMRYNQMSLMKRDVSPVPDVEILSPYIILFANSAFTISFFFFPYESAECHILGGNNTLEDTIRLDTQGSFNNIFYRIFKYCCK